MFGLRWNNLEREPSSSLVEMMNEVIGEKRVTVNMLKRDRSRFDLMLEHIWQLTNKWTANEVIAQLWTDVVQPIERERGREKPDIGWNELWINYYEVNLNVQRGKCISDKSDGSW